MAADFFDPGDRHSRRGRGREADPARPRVVRRHDALGRGRPSDMTPEPLGRSACRGPREPCVSPNSPDSRSAKSRGPRFLGPPEPRPEGEHLELSQALGLSGAVPLLVARDGEEERAPDVFAALVRAPEALLEPARPREPQRDRVLLGKQAQSPPPRRARARRARARRGAPGPRRGRPRRAPPPRRGARAGAEPRRRGPRSAAASAGGASTALVQAAPSRQPASALARVASAENTDTAARTIAASAGACQPGRCRPATAAAQAAPPAASAPAERPSPVIGDHVRAAPSATRATRHATRSAAFAGPGISAIRAPKTANPARTPVTKAAARFRDRLARRRASTAAATLRQGLGAHGSGFFRK